MILVHVDEKINQRQTKDDNITSGWVVMRSLTQFHVRTPQFLFRGIKLSAKFLLFQELHRKLRPLSNELKTFDLPTTFKMFFLKNDKSSLEKAKGQIQKYLNVSELFQL